MHPLSGAALLAAAAVAIAASHDVSAEGADFNKENKLILANPSSVSPTTGAIQHGKLRLRAADITTPDATEERQPLVSELIGDIDGLLLLDLPKVTVFERLAPKFKQLSQNQMKYFREYIERAAASREKAWTGHMQALSGKTWKQVQDSLMIPADNPESSQNYWVLKRLVKADVERQLVNCLRDGDTPELAREKLMSYYTEVAVKDLQKIIDDNMKQYKEEWNARAVKQMISYFFLRQDLQQNEKLLQKGVQECLDKGIHSKILQQVYKIPADNPESWSEFWLLKEFVKAEVEQLLAKCFRDGDRPELARKKLESYYTRVATKSWQKIIDENLKQYEKDWTTLEDIRNVFLDPRRQHTEEELLERAKEFVDKGIKSQKVQDLLKIPADNPESSQNYWVLEMFVKAEVERQLVKYFRYGDTPEQARGDMESYDIGVAVKDLQKIVDDNMKQYEKDWKTLEKIRTGFRSPNEQHTEEDLLKRVKGVLGRDINSKKLQELLKIPADNPESSQNYWMLEMFVKAEVDQLLLKCFKDGDTPELAREKLMSYDTGVAVKDLQKIIDDSFVLYKENWNALSVKLMISDLFLRQDLQQNEKLLQKGVQECLDKGIHSKILQQVYKIPADNPESWSEFWLLKEFVKAEVKQLLAKCFRDGDTPELARKKLESYYTRVATKSWQKIINDNLEQYEEDWKTLEEISNVFLDPRRQHTEEELLERAKEFVDKGIKSKKLQDLLKIPADNPESSQNYWVLKMFVKAEAKKLLAQYFKDLYSPELARKELESYFTGVATKSWQKIINDNLEQYKKEWKTLEEISNVFLDPRRQHTEEELLERAKGFVDKGIKSKKVQGLLMIPADNPESSQNYWVLEMFVKAEVKQQLVKYFRYGDTPKLAREKLKSYDTGVAVKDLQKIVDDNMKQYEKDWKTLEEIRDAFWNLNGPQDDEKLLERAKEILGHDINSKKLQDLLKIPADNPESSQNYWVLKRFVKAEAKKLLAQYFKDLYSPELARKELESYFTGVATKSWQKIINDNLEQYKKEWKTLEEIPNVFLDPRRQHTEEELLERAKEFVDKGIKSKKVQDLLMIPADNPESSQNYWVLEMFVKAEVKQQLVKCLKDGYTPELAREKLKSYFTGVAVKDLQKIVNANMKQYEEDWKTLPVFKDISKVFLSGGSQLNEEELAKRVKEFLGRNLTAKRLQLMLTIPILYPKSGQNYWLFEKFVKAEVEQLLMKCLKAGDSPELAREKLESYDSGVVMENWQNFIDDNMNQYKTSWAKVNYKGPVGHDS